MENTPALIHAGPFANIAHGTNSVLADKIACKLADYVVTECGFGADLGAEKFFDIVCRQQPDLWPSAVVLVATCRAVKLHGGVPEKPETLLTAENPEAFKKGLQNLATHIKNLRKFGVPAIVAVNKFPFDTPAEINMIFDLCQKLEVDCATHEAFLKGGEGVKALAERRYDANARPPQTACSHQYGCGRTWQDHGVVLKQAKMMFNYMYRLAELKPGQRASVEFIRSREQWRHRVSPGPNRRDRMQATFLNYRHPM